MDPTQIDLTSVAGISAATWIVVQALKAALANAHGFSNVPLPVYAAVVSALLTWLSHDVLHLLPGASLTELVVQAVVASLTASGAWEQARSLTKPLSASTLARKSRGLIVVLLVAGMAGACASAGGALVVADDAIHDAIGIVRQAGKVVCDPQPASAQCKAFNAGLADAIRDARRFNEAVATDSVASVPAMVTSLESLARTLEGIMPDAQQRQDLRARIEFALSKLRALRR